MPSEQEMRQQIDQVNRQVIELHQQGRSTEALALAVQLCDQTRQAMGEHHSNYAISLKILAGLYKATGDYAQAEPLYWQAAEILRQTFGENHPVYAAGLNNLAGLYKAAGDYARAELLHRQALEIRRQALGEDHPHYAESLNNLAGLYKATGDYARAKPLYRQAIEIVYRALGATHPSYAASLNNLAGLYKATGDYTRAEPLYWQVLEIRRQALGEYHPDYAAGLDNLAELYRATRDYARAASLSWEAAEILRQTLGEEHPAYATRLDRVAGLCEAMGDYARAEPLHRRAVELTRRALGENHPDYATSLNNLAYVYQQMGDHARAEPMHRQALEIRRQALGETHPDYAQSLNNLAALYEAAANYARAEPLYRQALEIKRRALGENHSDYATSLSNLAVLYKEIGDHARAEPLFRQVLEIDRKVLGENHPDYATSLSNLAALYEAMADYARAELLYRQAMDIRRRVLGESHPSYANSLNNLAALYDATGDHVRAKSLQRQVVQICQQTLGETHPEYATSLNNLAALYKATGEYSQAERLYLQALEISLQRLGENHPSYATSLSNLAGLYKTMGNYAQAELLYRRACGIMGRALGTNHPSYAATLNNLASSYNATGDYALAEQLHRQALAIRCQALGENHPHCANSLNNLAALCPAQGRSQEGFDLLRRALTIDDRILGQVFTIGSESQRLASLWAIQGRLEAFLSLVSLYLADSRPAIQGALDVLLRRKALGAEALLAQRDAVLGGRYTHLQEPLRQLTLLRQQIAQKTLAGPTAGEDPAVHQRQLAEWHAERERQEQALARQIPEMNLEQKLRAADRRAVALGLPEGVALVEFVRLNVANFQAVRARGEREWLPARYLAFVLPAGEPDNVQMIDLGEAEPIDQMIADFRAAITRDPGERRRDQLPDADEESEEAAGTAPPVPPADQGTALRRALFDALVPHLGGRTRLLLCPDGDLTRLPFEVLPGVNGGRLIDTYQISYLSSGRDVLRFGTPASGQPRPPLVAADPDFDLVSQPVPVPSTPQKSGFFSWLLGGHHSRDLDRAVGASRLPGTRTEGERIAALLKVKPWLEGEVLEGRLKEQRSPRILHLATHGFFCKDQPHDPDAGSRWENPLLRSGLLLAGYNTWLARGELPPEAEDGMLTAEDVTGLDLLDTELVVLSACETGLGQIHVGEGVFGLRRAFVLAGAKTLVMSLWKVPDQQTQELMVDFYQRILAGQPRAEALRQAQLALKEKHPDPYYWGAFICQGDPAPLGLFKESAGHSG
jgi:CHAT domain-containing protein/tetratricopeptide (TPR) repeat protein